MADHRSNPRRTNDSPIAAARLAAGLTQAQLAEAVGVSQQQIARWDASGKNLKMQTLMRIGEALGVKWEMLV